jgi:predicted transcriptional regulator
MTLDNSNRSRDLLSSVTDIVTVYLQKNEVPPDRLAMVISSVTSSLKAALSDGASNTSAAIASDEQPAVNEPASVQATAAQPAVPVSESVQPDALICLECGAKQTLLRRHLSVAHGLTPQAYRAKWSLDRRYPMAAPNFAEQRRIVAKRIGLGRGGPGQPPIPAEVATPATAAAEETRPADTTPKDATTARKQKRGKAAAAKKTGSASPRTKRATGQKPSGRKSARAEAGVA